MKSEKWPNRICMFFLVATCFISGLITFVVAIARIFSFFEVKDMLVILTVQGIILPFLITNIYSAMGKKRFIKNLTLLLCSLCVLSFFAIFAAMLPISPAPLFLLFVVGFSTYYSFHFIFFSSLIAIFFSIFHKGKSNTKQSCLKWNMLAFCLLYFLPFIFLLLFDSMFFYFLFV